MPKTVAVILKEVRRVKQMSRETLYQDFRRLKIKPIAARQSPQLYPDDATNKILERRGLLPKPARNGKR